MRIIICDDHYLITEGLRRFISDKPDMELVAVANSISELEGYLQEVEVDILILDINLPDGNGIELTEKLKIQYPTLKIIGLSSLEDRFTILSMVKKGVSGYLVKSAPLSEIEKAIREVNDGKVYFGAEAQLALSNVHQEEDKIPSLTKREKEVLQWLSEGLSSSEIGEKMFISSQTVDTHRKSLMRKFEVSKTVNLITKAKEIGIID